MFTIDGNELSATEHVEYTALRSAFGCVFRDLARHGVVPYPDEQAIDAAFSRFLDDAALAFNSWRLVA